MPFVFLNWFSLVLMSNVICGEFHKHKLSHSLVIMILFCKTWKWWIRKSHWMVFASKYTESLHWHIIWYNLSVASRQLKYVALSIIDGNKMSMMTLPALFQHYSAIFIFLFCHLLIWGGYMWFLKYPLMQGKTQNVT